MLPSVRLRHDIRRDGGRPARRTLRPERYTPWRAILPSARRGATGGRTLFPSAYSKQRTDPYPDGMLPPADWELWYRRGPLAGKTNLLYLHRLLDPGRVAGDLGLLRRAADPPGRLAVRERIGLEAEYLGPRATASRPVCQHRRRRRPPLRLRSHEIRRRMPPPRRGGDGVQQLPGRRHRPSTSKGRPPRIAGCPSRACSEPTARLDGGDDRGVGGRRNMVAADPLIAGGRTDGRERRPSRAKRCPARPMADGPRRHARGGAAPSKSCSRTPQVRIVRDRPTWRLGPDFGRVGAGHVGRDPLLRRQPGEDRGRPRGAGGAARPVGVQPRCLRQPDAGDLFPLPPGPGRRCAAAVPSSWTPTRTSSG